MKIGVYPYHCIKCGEQTAVQYLPCIQSRTYQLFMNMAEAKLCKNCYLDSKIPQTAEIIQGLYVQ